MGGPAIGNGSLPKFRRIVVTFDLDPRLAQESVLVSELGVSRLLLRDEHRFPWLVLVPRRPDVTELFALSAPDRAAVMEEVSQASQLLLKQTTAEKINVGALGNIVSQLHIHVIGRRGDDPAWPGPVWGFGEREPYGPEALEGLAEKLRAGISA